MKQEFFIHFAKVKKFTKSRIHEIVVNIQKKILCRVPPPRAHGKQLPLPWARSQGTRQSWRLCRGPDRGTRQSSSPLSPSASHTPHAHATHAAISYLAPALAHAAAGHTPPATLAPTFARAPAHAAGHARARHAASPARARHADGLAGAHDAAALACGVATLPRSRRRQPHRRSHRRWQGHIVCARTLSFSLARG